MRAHYVKRAQGWERPEGDDEHSHKTLLVHGQDHWNFVRSKQQKVVAANQGVEKSLEHSRRWGDQRNMLSRSVMRMTRQWAIVLLTIGAWLLISNHCVLGLGDTVADSDSKSAGCPMHSAPAKGKPAANLPCCKDLHAIAPHAVKNLTAVASQLVGVQNYVAVILSVSARLTTQLLALGTGPPPWLSFAESILQRSILAHAPPAGFPRL